MATIWRIIRTIANDMELQENSIIVSDRLDGVFDVELRNHFTCPGAEQMYQNAASEVKELQVIAEATHFDMYNLEEYVTQNLQHIERFLKANL